MFAPAKNKIGETPSHAFPFIGEIAEPFCVTFYKLSRGTIAIRSSNPKNSSRLQTSEEITKMKMKQRIRQMFDNMMRIDDVNRSISER